MPTKTYVAISPSVSRTGDAVLDDPGATYAATFASVTAAIADATYGARDITVATGSDEICYFDVFEDINETGNASISFNGFTKGLANYVVLRAAPGYEHRGTPGNGVKIRRTDAGVYLYNPDERLKTLDLEFEHTATGFGSIRVYGGLGCEIRRCISSSNSFNSFELWGEVLVESCLGLAPNNTGFQLERSVDKITVVNSTALNCARGFTDGGNVYTRIVRNCVAVDCSLAGFAATDSWNALSDYNASTDATAPGANSLQNIVSSNEFENAPGNLPFLKAGNTLETAGVDASSYGAANDIENQPYTGWPIGCDQPGAFTVPVTLTCLDAETLLPIAGVDVYVKAESGGPLAVGTEIAAGTTDANGEVVLNPEFTSAQPFLAQGRKGTAAPFYREGKILGTITGDGYTGNIYMISDED